MKTPLASTGMSRDPIITTCPDCGTFVKLPSCVSIEATVQCPTCKDRYPVRSLLPDTIPELIVVRDSVANPHQLPAIHVGDTAEANQLEIVASVPSRLEVPSILKNGARRRKRNRSGRSGNVVSNAESTLDSQSLEKRRRLKRKSGSNSNKNRTSHSWAEESIREFKPRNPQIEFVKIVVGGLLALPVAQLIIWWVIGMDPLQLAPTVSKFVPFAVPTKFRVVEEAPTEAEVWPSVLDKHNLKSG